MLLHAYPITGLVGNYTLNKPNKTFGVPKMNKPFGDWVRAIRESRGLSLRALAEKSGVTHPTISGIENGSRGATRNMVRALADGLEVTRSEAVRAWLEDEAQEGGGRSRTRADHGGRPRAVRGAAS